MTNDRTRKRAKLDFGDFEDFDQNPKPKAPPKVQKEIAEASGFTSRQTVKSQEKIDGRTLRATGRTVQMNMAVKPETKNEFWKLLQESGHTRSEEFLLEMMDRWKSRS